MRIEYILIALAFIAVICEAVVLYRLARESKRLEKENNALWREYKCLIKNQQKGKSISLTVFDERGTGNGV
jgi:hypothetical protein